MQWSQHDTLDAGGEGGREGASGAESGSRGRGGVETGGLLRKEGAGNKDARVSIEKEREGGQGARPRKSLDPKVPSPPACKAPFGLTASEEKQGKVLMENYMYIMYVYVCCTY